LPGEPGLAGFIEAKDGIGRDNWSYKTCKAPVKSSPPINQHPTYYRPDALPVAQPTVSKAMKGMKAANLLKSKLTASQNYCSHICD